MLAALPWAWLLGLLNGWLIGYLQLPPIVITLGTMSVYRGMVFVLSGGAWVSSHQMPADFVAFPLTRVLGLAHLVWIAAAAVLGVVLHAPHPLRARPVRHRQCARSARYVGIPIARRLLWTYGLSGAMAGLCGYLWVARYAVAYTELAYGFEFTVIAACVIGGISIAGGVGSVAGAVLGALFLAVIGNALPVLKVSPFWQSALTGCVILVAVLINARHGKQGSRQILPLQAHSRIRNQQHEFQYSTRATPSLDRLPSACAACWEAGKACWRCCWGPCSWAACCCRTSSTCTTCSTAPSTSARRH
jgi:rhamnose transport system permease protein